MSDGTLQPWPEVCLGELGDLRTSSVDKLTSPNEIRVQLVNYMDVYRNRFIDSTLNLQQVTASLAERSAFQVKKGDVLFTPSSETPDDICHAAAVVDHLPETLHSYHTVRLRLTEPAASEVRFLAQLLNSDEAKAHLTKRATGSTRYTLTLGDFRSMRVALPPLEEQHRIAQVLDTIDETIRATERVIAKLETTRLAILHELVAELPDSSARTLAEALMDPLCYGIVQVGKHVPNGVPVVAIRDLEGDFSADLHRTSEAIDSKYPRSRVTGGEVLLSIKGTIGRVGLVPTMFTGNISRDVALLRTTSDLRSDYLMWFLRSTEGQRRLRHISVGTTRAELSLHALRRVRVPVPSLAVQEDVVTAVDQASACLGRERRHLVKLRGARTGLAADLLSGRVRTVAA